MNRIFAPAIAVAILAGIHGTAQSQNTSPGVASTTALPPKVGLIDMARVFKEYKKFEVIREKLKTEFEGTQKEAQAKAQQVQQLQAQMQTVTEGSPEYNQYEQKAVQLASELKAFGQMTQRDMFRKEAQLYKEIYLEVEDMVGKYAQFKKFTLVLRFNSEELDAEDPQKIISGMNRQVVFHRAEDDITDQIIKYLNDVYAKNNGVQQTSGTDGGTSRVQPAN